MSESTVGKRIRIRRFCPQCDQHIKAIDRYSDGRAVLRPCGHQDRGHGRTEVVDEPSPSDPQETA